MYELHYFPGNANLAPHMLLEEIGVAYRLSLVDRAADEHKSAAYLAINPNGRIPTLVHDGHVVFEAAAIMLHLVDRHPDAGFAPPAGSHARAALYQWLCFLTNTVQEDLMTWHYPERLVGRDASATALVRGGAQRRVSAHLDVVEAHLVACGPYFVGGAVSVVDLFFTMLARWARSMPSPPRARPSCEALLNLIVARPAVRRACRSEGITDAIA